MKSLKALQTRQFISLIGHTARKRSKDIVTIRVSDYNAFNDFIAIDRGLRFISVIYEKTYQAGQLDTTILTLGMSCAEGILTPKCRIK